MWLYEKQRFYKQDTKNTNYKKQVTFHFIKLKTVFCLKDTLSMKNAYVFHIFIYYTYTINVHYTFNIHYIFNIHYLILYIYIHFLFNIIYIIYIKAFLFKYNKNSYNSIRRHMIQFKMDKSLYIQFIKKI